MERSSTCRLIPLIVLGSALAFVACGSTSPDVQSTPDRDGSAGGIDLRSAERTYTITTTECGYASATKGTGVALGLGQVLTSAHVVIAASLVEVRNPAGEQFEARIVALDPGLDLALLQIPDDGLDPLEFQQLEEGESAIVQTRAGAVSVEVAQTLNLDVFEIRGTGRSQRAGYRLTGTTESGDSGSGLFGDHGLAGSVFATTTEDDETTWATAASEIEDFLREEFSGGYVCDPEESRIVEVSG